MSAINFVVRDVAGNISRGSVAGEGVPSSLIVGVGADVSLNLSQGQIVSYTRQGRALKITLIDGRVIVIEGYFTMEGVSENELFLSANGFITEVDLNQGAGADYYANYIQSDQAVGKFSMNDDMVFMRDADVMLADSFIPEDDQVGMLGAFAPLLGVGGAATAVGGAALLVGTGGGGGGSGPGAPVVEIMGDADGGNQVVNQEDHTGGVDIVGTGTPGGIVDVTIDGVTETTTVDEDGNWSVVFDPEDIAEGEYETEVDVVITTDDGTTTATDTLVVDTVIGVDMNAAGGEGGIINAVEYGDGVTLTGTLVGCDKVVVTIGGVDYNAVIDGDTWSLDVETSVLGEGEYTETVTVTATDDAGNSSSSTGTVVVDTVIGVDMNAVGGVINATEFGSGITLGGTITGNAASVVVTIDGVDYNAVVTGSSWSLDVSSSVMGEGEYSKDITVTATDAAGNASTATGSVTVDTLVNELEMTSNSAGGADGVVNFDESSQSITMAGTVEAGSTVSVNLHGVVMAATVDANGNWSVTYPGGSLPGGKYDTNVTVKATDGAGNTSTLTEPVTVDTVAGDLALSTQPIEIDDVVNMVEAQDGVIIHGTATPGLVVTVGFGSFSMDVLAQPDGTWSANFPSSMVPADQDAASITASITDAAGNYKEVSDTLAIDTVVQPHEWSATPVEGNDVINAAEASNGVILSGKTEAGSSIVVEFGGQSVTVISGSDGTWNANFAASTVTANAEYTASMKATATDPAGNVSVITDTVKVDTWVNNLTTTDPVEGNNVVNATEASDGVTLGGTVEAGSTVVVTFAHPGGVITQNATVDAAGNWTVTYAGSVVPLGEYDANITIAATDANGNTDSITDTFKVDTLAPDVPEVTNLSSSNAGVNAIITAAPEGDVTVNEITASHQVNELATTADGMPFGGGIGYTFDAPLSNGSHLMVTDTDAAGNQNATFVVLEETATNAVDLGGLSGFDIGSIDLGFSKDAQLTLDLNTLKELTNDDNSLIITSGDGDTADTVTILGADSTGSKMIGSTNYNTYTLGDDSEIIIEDGIVVMT